MTTDRSGRALRHQPGVRGDPAARADRSDRGAATVLVLALAVVLTGCAVVLASLGAVAVARHRAAAVADLAALAAADHSLEGPAAACAAAARVAAASGAEIGACVLQGQVAQVVARVRPSGRLGLLGSAAARSRAGPTGS